MLVLLATLTKNAKKMYIIIQRRAGVGFDNFLNDKKKYVHKGNSSMMVVPGGNENKRSHSP
jgi:hypothetical protein